jgi:hypothetical protein
MNQTNDKRNELREFTIGGISFLYHEQFDEFREKANPSNKIPMKDIWEDNIWTGFFFDQATKNIYTGRFPNGHRPAGVHYAVIPSIPYAIKSSQLVGKLYPSMKQETVELKVWPSALTQNVRKKYKKGKSI